MKTILFDLDNTLTHREQTIRNYTRVFFSDYAHQLITGLDPIWLADKIVTLDEGGYSGHRERSFTLAMLDIWRTRPDANDLLEHWLSWVPAHPVMMPGLYHVLNKLKHWQYTLGIVTNGAQSIQQAKICALKIEQYFDVILTSEAAGMSKPDSGIFLAALSVLQCQATDAIYVGDHPINDYQGAMDCGMKAIWFRGFHIWPQNLAPPQSYIDHLEHLLDKV
ncbi:HAD family hydrolase [Gynuella sunshinyii]|uniref:Putative hydrolase (HAD superfamily) n=1 Tax=Gynuella sunshinyii YC6258 TaxID=1445510 RepID=A0A0C5VMZ3_9GAMM|nr:HAD family hydrolase [Gynuella sunshinyii]AJQ94698.1 putative hydrolase (HAD superfamily) [Gynuella sunshinyii YC6258]